MSAAIEEIRALLRDFAKSPWRELHFRAGTWEAFFAKVGAASNPLLRSIAAPRIPAIAVTAPHLGIVRSLAAAGTQVTLGAIVATVDVLGRLTDIRAEASGRVEACLAAEGALIEYGEPLLTIAPG